MFIELPLIIALLAERIEQVGAPHQVIRYDEGTPLVYSGPAPRFNRQRERLLYFVSPSAGGPPFSYLGEPLVVGTQNVDNYVAEYAAPGRVAVLVCRAQPPILSTSVEVWERACEVRE